VSGPDDGHAIAYTALAAGTPVVAADGSPVGSVDRVLENTRERIFDGIVIRTPSGDERFVDAPEIGRIAERRVTLTIDSIAAAGLPDHEPGPPVYQADARAGRLRRLLGGSWRRRR